MYACTLADDIHCEGQTNVECFACGERVCKSCSALVEWSTWGVKRVCNECVREDYKIGGLFLREENERRHAVLEVS